MTASPARERPRAPMRSWLDPRDQRRQDVRDQDREQEREGDLAEDVDDEDAEEREAPELRELPHPREGARRRRRRHRTLILAVPDRLTDATRSATTRRRPRCRRRVGRGLALLALLALPLLLAARPRRSCPVSAASLSRMTSPSVAVGTPPEKPCASASSSARVAPRIDRPILRSAVSTPMISAFSVWPGLTNACADPRRARREISETWTRPSMPFSSSTKAPKSSTLMTLPSTILPTG